MRKPAFLIAILIALTSCCFQKHCVNVSEQTIVCGSDILIEDIRIPIIGGLSDKQFENNVNSNIMAIVNTAREAAKQDALTAQQWVPYVCVLVIDYAVNNNCELFSMRITTDLENGGTGMPNSHYFNIDVMRNKLLHINDLFLPSSEYDKAIDEYIFKIISKDKRFSPQDFPGITKDTAFFINSNRLHIAFAKYEIACGTTGEPEFAIPSPVIRDYLKPDYAYLR